MRIQGEWLVSTHCLNPMQTLWHAEESLARLEQRGITTSLPHRIEAREIGPWEPLVSVEAERHGTTPT